MPPYELTHLHVPSPLKFLALPPDHACIFDLPPSQLLGLCKSWITTYYNSFLATNNHIWNSQAKNFSSKMNPKNWIWDSNTDTVARKHKEIKKQIESRKILNPIHQNRSSKNKFSQNLSTPTTVHARNNVGNTPRLQWIRTTTLECCSHLIRSLEAPNQHRQPSQKLKL